MPDIRLKYPVTSSTAITITLDNLPTNSQGVFTLGRTSAAVSNESDNDLDHLLGGRIRISASAAAGRSVNVYVIAPRSMSSGTPTWPDVVDGTNVQVTFTSAQTLAAAARLAVSITSETNASGRNYDFSGISVASLFGGVLPPEYVVFVAQDTGAILTDPHSLHYFRVQGQSV